jgi:hypothetical protein
VHAAPPFNRVPTKSVRTPCPYFSIKKHHFPGLFAVFCTAKALFPQWFCCLSPLPPCPPSLSLSLPSLACTQTFAMTTAVKGTVVNGVFTTADGGSGFAASAPVPIEWLSRGTVVAITLTGKSYCFSVAIASTNALNNSVHWFNDNHHAAFHYSSAYGRVNSYHYDSSKATFSVYCVRGGAPFTAVLTLRGSDRTVSFAVNGVQQSGVWALPTTDAFYLMLATHDDSGNNIAVTDVTVTGTA